MAVTMEDVRAALDPEEPDYEEAAGLGPAALPHLQVLVNSGDPMLASKAAYLASLIDDVRAAEVVEEAARSVDPIVRVAAAAAAANLGATVSSNVLRNLSNDPDAGVRKVAGGRGGAFGLAGHPEGKKQASVSRRISLSSVASCLVSPRTTRPQQDLPGCPGNAIGHAGRERPAKWDG